MALQVQFQSTPEQAKDDDFLRKRIKEELNLTNTDFQFKWKKRSIDARQRQVKVNCSFNVFVDGEAIPKLNVFTPQDVSEGKSIAIIGSGPAGLFAALKAIELGLKPIVFERGKDVRSRRRDLAILNKESIVNPESNYCFGEGGAGTYSDGKLYTRSKKRGDVQKALELFVHFGATEDILVDAHPHIGTNKLPEIIIAMREAIIEHGGEVKFESKITNILAKEGKVKGVEVNGAQQLDFDNVILATGHSARDIFKMIHKNGWTINSKPFALGVRIEHPQDLIDKIQYRGRVSDEFIPPASYSLVTQVNNRGVYSFCMCPGGIIAPCATEQGEVVTNGWSPSKRNNPFANSGIVVSISPDDFDDKGPFVCLDFQQSVEQACWEAAGKTQKVPAQRLIDFVEGRKSKDLPKTSYQPGLCNADLNDVLPPLVRDPLRKAFKEFGQKMNGFYTNEAVLHAPESRTSSPVQIPRGKDLQHPDVKGLYPCAEGAGYAGGIISAAIDGMKCITAIYEAEVS
ncbi:MAG: FAD-dependent oxidoreductase [Crocinitomicaceae bacterium]|nr:FAD-dependent oxidoreductase [Crocinitomicaceae bacterium]